jgi:predicted Zn-dependent protease
MARAGYNPEKAITLWERSEEVFGSADSSVGAFFSTHPASGDRIDELREFLPLAMKEYRPKRRG